MRNNDQNGFAASVLVKPDQAENHEAVADLILLPKCPPPSCRAGREFICSQILRTHSQQHKISGDRVQISLFSNIITVLLDIPNKNKGTNQGQI